MIKFEKIFPRFTRHLQFARYRIRIAINRITRVKPRVKLIAIARDEAAYLPEWIAHHLYFGFDNIEVHYNRCSDNTAALVEMYSNDPRVNLICADEFFNTHRNNPQVGLYRNKIKEAQFGEFSHLCFLDIDEFWTPLDLSSSIKDCIQQNPKADVVSFEWCNKLEAPTPFDAAICQDLKVQRARQVKSIVRTGLALPRLNPHTVLEKLFVYFMANGERLDYQDKAMSKVPHKELEKPLKPFIVIHRMWRSELEYVALLGRGRPRSEFENSSRIKDNRTGYSDGAPSDVLTFPTDSYHNYCLYLQQALKPFDASEIAENARDGVIKRFDEVLGMIRHGSPEQLELFERVLNQLTIPEVLEAFREFKLNNQIP